MTPGTIALPTPNDGAKLRSMVGAVIYIRVSTKEQTENLSLPTQLRACEEYCRREGFEILERFKEEGESAKTADRTELQRLLKFCRTNKGKVHFVVVFNLTRFARDKFDHFALRSHLKSLGISLRSATEPIDDTSTGKLMEGVLASFAQFDNDVRSDSTRAGMKEPLSSDDGRSWRRSVPQCTARDAAKPDTGSGTSFDRSTTVQAIRERDFPTQGVFISGAVGQTRHLIRTSDTSRTSPPALIGELNDDIDRPWAVFRRVGAAPRVVSLEARVEIRGKAGIEARRVVRILQDVNDALGRCGHARISASAVPARYCRKLEHFERLLPASRRIRPSVRLRAMQILRPRQSPWDRL